MANRRALSLAVLTDLDFARATFDRPPQPLRQLPERAVQFGTGAFLRGFVDAFIDEANRRGQFLGRVVAVGSTGSGRDRAFGDQEGLYTLIVAGVRDGTVVNERRIIGSVSRAIGATSQWDDVLAVARDPEIRLVFSNTTEAGIALDARDTNVNAQPHSYPAKLTRFLLERATTFAYATNAGVIVLPCELIEDNGARLATLVREQATRWELGELFDAWLSSAVRFCNTLVDRIVPGTPDAAEHARLCGEFGYDDALLTVAEPYALFAIEGDEALAERLGFVDPNGVIRIVPDIRPYRERKVRLLNGTHTAMAALGLLAGVSTVYDAMHSPMLAPVLQQLAKCDIAPMLDVPEAEAFAETVLQRFANPKVRHRLTDIASQGTLKWKVRLLPMLRRHAEESGVLPASLVLALAAQLYLSHPIERARRAAAGIAAFTDDNGDMVHAHWLSHGAAAAGGDGTHIPAFVEQVLSDRLLWDSDLRDIAGLPAHLTESLQRLHNDGVQSLLSPALVTS